mgnify:CR=1 FL=1
MHGRKQRIFRSSCKAGAINDATWPFQTCTEQNGDKMEKVFDGKKPAKLGTEKNPAVVTVKTKTRMKELQKIFEEGGWSYRIEWDKTKPEDISDLELLQTPVKTVNVEKKVGRNDPCPCGSGKKYKKCCGR